MVDDQLSKGLHQLFLGDHYSIESLLAKAQENNLTLQQLKDLLIKHQQDLNQSSIELFNNNYDRFYKLSSVITSLKEPIQHLISPIEEFHSHLEQLCKGHDSYLEAINTKLSNLEETCKNKLVATKLIELIKRYDRIERQLESVDLTSIQFRRGKSRTPKQSVHNQRSQTCNIRHTIVCDLLERINVEIFYLTKEVNAILPTSDELIPIKNNLMANLATRQQQLDIWFRGCFLEAIEIQDRELIDLSVRTYKQIDEWHKLDQIWQNYVVKPILDNVASSLTNAFSVDSTELNSTQVKFKLKLTRHIYDYIIRCWSCDLYIENLDSEFSRLACQILNRFSEWLSQLRLSDFRIVGASSLDNNRQTNFLARQDAIMRLLIEDCSSLKSQVLGFVASLPNNNSKLTAIRNDLLSEGFKALENGLDNVKSLQHLIER